MLMYDLQYHLFIIKYFRIYSENKAHAFNKIYYVGRERRRTPRRNKR